MVCNKCNIEMACLKEEKNGQIKLLGPKEKLEFDIEAGYLEQERAREIKRKIDPNTYEKAYKLFIMYRNKYLN